MLVCGAFCDQEGADVGYPGLRSHKQHELLERLRNADYGHGGILTLDLGSQKVTTATTVKGQWLARTKPCNLVSQFSVTACLPGSVERQPVNDAKWSQRPVFYLV